MNLWFRCVLLIVVAVCPPGCGGGARPVSGGTNGMLHSGPTLLSEIQITVHQVEGSATKPIGFGVAGMDGAFQLISPGATGPLQLAPGEYRFTLESVGAPVVIPKEFTQPETTPLKVNWTGSEAKLDFDIPPLPLSR